MNHTKQRNHASVSLLCCASDRYYFAIQSNPGEQFFTFSCLSAWLIKRRSGLDLGSRDLRPQEFEDPNVTISTILDLIREAAQERVDFPPGKVKQGWGSEVIGILTVLADISLRRNHKNSSAITLKGLQSIDTDTDVTASEENDPEISFDEHFSLMAEDEDENEERSYNEHHSFPGKQSQNMLTPEDASDAAAAVPDVDTSAWMQELDRVLPQLRVVVKSSDLKSDWRVRVNQLEVSQSELEGQFERTRATLNRLTQEIEKNVDKISGREKYLQTQFEPLINEYISLKSQLGQLTDQYGEVSRGVTQKSQILSEISEELESMKSEMEERGSSMSDGTPLVSLRKGLQRVKAEVSSIDIRIGVATHTILQSNLKDSMMQLVTRRGGDGQDVSALSHDSLQKLLF
jgi:estrogen-related receptor beta like 1